VAQGVKLTSQQKRAGTSIEHAPLELDIRCVCAKLGCIVSLDA
jgi:hypothetical protein